MSRPKGIAWFDIETTGLDPELHEIVEIGIVRTSLDGLHVEGVLELKVRPNRLEAADPRALEVNGFTEAGWRDSVDLEEAVVRALPLLDGAMIGGHNVGFDVGFFGRASRDLGVRPGWSHRRIDTQSLAWPLLASGVVETTSLDEVCRALGIERPSPHRAINDARAARAVALTLLSRFQLSSDEGTAWQLREREERIKELEKSVAELRETTGDLALQLAATLMAAMHVLSGEDLAEIGRRAHETVEAVQRIRREKEDG